MKKRPGWKIVPQKRYRRIADRPSSLSLVSWDLNCDGELAGAPDGMAFSAGADFMVTI